MEIGRTGACSKPPASQPSGNNKVHPSGACAYEPLCPKPTCLVFIGENPKSLHQVQIVGQKRCSKREGGKKGGWQTQGAVRTDVVSCVRCFSICSCWPVVFILSSPVPVLSLPVSCELLESRTVVGSDSAR